MRTCRLACWAAVWLGAAHSQGRSGQEPGEPGAARRRGQEQGYDEELDLWINFAPSDAEEVEEDEEEPAEGVFTFPYKIL